MSAIARMLVVVAALLAVLLAVQATRLIDAVTPGMRVEIASARTVSVGPEARQRLASLANDVALTYYVSDPGAMPSSMRHIRRDVEEVLRGMERHAGGRLHIKVVNPEGDDTLEILAARHRAAPFRVRTITRDGHDERTVWSSITVASGPHPVAVINGVEPDVLPNLQSLILRHVEAMERPRRPVFALAAGPGAATGGGGGFGALAGALAAFGEVVEVDLNRAPEQGGGRIPERADVLFWMDPAEIPSARVREIARFMERGRSVVVAGSRYRPVPAPGGVAFEAQPYGLETLLAEFGLSGEQGLVTDQFSVPVAFGEIPARELPFLVRCLPQNQDFSRMRMPVNGNVIFAAPTPFSPLGTSRDWRTETLMTLSDGALVHALPEGPISAAELDQTFARERGALLARQPLAVRVRSVVPGSGDLIAFAASTPLRDEWLTAPNVAHPRMVEAIVRTLAAPDRLVQIDAAVVRRELPSELPVWKRLAWRVIVLSLIPLVLALIAWRRGVFRREGGESAAPVQTPGAKRASARSGTSGGRAAPAKRTRFESPIGVAGGVVIVGCAVVLVIGARLRGGPDLTESGFNELPGELVTLLREVSSAGAAESATPGEIAAEIIFSDPAGMPPGLRAPARRTRELMGDLARASRGQLSVRQIRPDGLTPEELEQYAEIGARPVEVVDRDEEVVLVRQVHASIVLRRGEQAEVVRFTDAAGFASAPLRLALAVTALRDGVRPHVAVASDVPRLTPAEAHELYQQRGLTAPMGTDVYARARGLLEETGFRVTHVVPRDPVVPDDIDAIIWLQPRRPAAAMLEQFTHALGRGVPGMIALQHFNMQARQYPGRGYSIVYWPQPQFMEIDRLWLSRIGVDVPREVFFDERMLALPAESQIYRGDDREAREQSSALPFLVRAVRDNFDVTQPPVAGVGDLAMPWVSAITLQDDVLREKGIEAHPLIRSSAMTWSYEWSGGFLPPELMEGRDEEGELLPREGPALLAVSLHGTFPVYERPAPGEPEDAQMQRPLLPGSAQSQLLLVGSSEMFKDARLLDREFPSDHLLVSSAVHLIGDPALAALAARRPVSRGFDLVDSRQRLTLRVFVLAGVPILILLVGLGRAAQQRWSRPVVPAGAAGSHGPRAPRAPGPGEPGEVPA